jgi:pyridoxal phosphate enzyme (YggS family)
MSDQRAATLANNYNAVRERVDKACARVGRDPEEVTLVAVSKTWPASDLQALYDHGVRHFGESYAQEWEEKAPQLPDDVAWHFIGHLQSNKARVIAGHTHLVHSVDRNSLIKELSKRSGQEGATSRVLLQVNVGEDENKSGVDTEEVFGLLEKATNREHLVVCGLMTIPPFEDDPEVNRENFRQLAALLEPCRAWLDERGLLEKHPFEEISMGMSGDFEIAIEEGATLVRVGSAIFGSRTYSND